MRDHGLGARGKRARGQSRRDRRVAEALRELAEREDARRVGQRRAHFPHILKAGFIFGGQGGDGVLRKGGKNAGYYRSVAASYGFQAGIQKFSYVPFFMMDPTLKYLDKSDGWEIGTSPSVVIVDKGMAQSLSTTLHDDVNAFIFGQRLMAGVGIQGSKITRVDLK